MNNIRFGANYIPSKNWLHSWMNWDSKSVEEDLIAIKDMGLDHIRAHLIWPYFQINPNAMSPSAMKNLEDFMKICDKVGIDCFITLFTGWMSGFRFLPHYQEKLTGSYNEGVFNNPEMIKAEEFYIREVAKVVTKSKSFVGFDLGNELTMLVYNDDKVTIPECDAWHKRMLALCNELAPGKLNNNGVDHQPWFNEFGFSREVLANVGEIIPLHTYALFTGAIERFGRMSTESYHLAPFMTEMAKAFANDLNQPYWIQEFGTVEDEFTDETEEFILRSMEAMYTSKDMWITWWCTHNLPEGYTGYDSIEYKLGLLDCDNKPTPSGELFKRIIKKYKEESFVPPERTTAFVLKSYDSNGVMSPDIIWGNGKRYAELVEQGIYPAMILPEKANDIEYLKMRGIEKVLPD